jgi:putative aldouronate transport system substrate-binding protein
VEIFDRNNDGGTPPADNYYTDFIKKGLLEKHNIEVEFIPVPRWTEGDDINNMLAAGTAPDICVTYSAPTIQLYAAMGGVHELTPYLDELKDITPNMWDFLGDTGIYWSKNPDTGELYYIEGKRANIAKQTTFVRNDWLDTLGLSVPTSLGEFHDMLAAFRDNAATLLPNEPDKMIPLLVTYDVGWIAAPLINAYIPDAITDKDLYTLGFDDRFLLFPGYKESIHKLNEWYNEGLIWKDFALYGAGDTTNELLSKAGYVGAQMQNWDQLYRNGEDSVISNIRRATGNDKAGYVACTPFPNDAGIIRTFPYAPIGSDRKVFFPASNDEVHASLLYLDWISDAANRQYLQIGDEGVTHSVESNGGIKTIAVTGEKIMNSLNNIDYTITCNGLSFADPDVTMKSIALGYAGVEPELVIEAYELSQVNPRFNNAGTLGTIVSEEGKGTELSAKRDVFLDQAVVAAPDKFDSVFDGGFNDYLASGGQAIIDERTQVWEKYFGSSTSLNR